MATGFGAPLFAEDFCDGCVAVVEDPVEGAANEEASRDRSHGAERQLVFDAVAHGRSA